MDIPDGGFDLIIMNPPFTRNTNKAGVYANTFAGAFAALNSSSQDQRNMAKRIGFLKEGTCYHGHAGMASAFAALANRKLKNKGVLALVLPLSAATGFAWQAFRQMLSENFNEVAILTIAAAEDDGLSFSADTGMAECLVIAKKSNASQEEESKATFISFGQRPTTLIDASSLSKTIMGQDDIRDIGNGPFGGTPVVIGEEKVGEILLGSYPADGVAWGAVRLSDFSLAQASHALTSSTLWLPGYQSPLEIRMTRLELLGRMGHHHLDIAGMPSSGIPQGPFEKADPSPTSTYPALWNHRADHETFMVCQPDYQLLARMGMEPKAIAVWESRSRGHLNLDFRFNSQPLSVAFTDRESIGGRAWPNVKFNVESFDYALSTWCNGTLGLVSFWWHANRQQSGRGTTTIRSAETLPVLDFRTLTDEQLAKAEEIFEEFRDKELLPAYLADADPNRALLDYRVICDLLGFDESIYQGVRRLAQKWCAEPSVHGGKARPKNAKLVM